ncbi:MAG: alpha/beta hydrolase [Anaerolineales bacterium]
MTVRRSPGAGLAWTEHADAAGPESPPIVLIHGAGGGRLSWPPALRRMAGGRVFALDLPGHGQAPGPGATTIGGYAEVVLDWLRQVQIGAALLVGHSMGAAIALTVAARRERSAPSGVETDGVAGLVLMGLGPRLKVDPITLELASSPKTVPQAVDRITEWGFAPGASSETLGKAKEQMLETPADVLQRDLIACDRFEAGPRTDQVRVATLVLCGSLDRLTPPVEGRRLAEAIPGARFHLVQGAGHMLMIEKAEEVAALVRDFVRQLDLTGAR